MAVAPPPLPVCRRKRRAPARSGVSCFPGCGCGAHTADANRAPSPSPFAFPRLADADRCGEEEPMAVAAVLPKVSD